MIDTFTIDACEEAFVRDFCPYKGSPDPLVVWRAAWNAARAHALDEAAQTCTRIGELQGTLGRQFAVQDCFEAVVALKTA